jgi:hypothetical protein
MMRYQLGQNLKIPMVDLISIIPKQQNQHGINLLYSVMLLVENLFFINRFLKTIVFDLDVQNQLEHVNKTMYESEKEVKRLESEQSQLPTTTSTDKQQQLQQQSVPTPAFLNGFTLEKLDNNEARRFVCNYK